MLFLRYPHNKTNTNVQLESENRVIIFVLFFSSLNYEMPARILQFSTLKKNFSEIYQLQHSKFDILEVKERIRTSFFSDPHFDVFSCQASTMIQLYGQPYHPNTLCAVPPDTDAIMNRVSQ